MNKPETKLVAPFLYPKECIIEPRTRGEIPPMMLRVLNHVKANKNSTIPSMMEALNITKWMTNRTTDKLIQGGMLRVDYRSAALNQPRRFFEAINDKPTIH
jgi:hypothetical protein